MTRSPATAAASRDKLRLVLDAIEKLPNPLAQGGADLAEAVAEDGILDHFVIEAVA